MYSRTYLYELGNLFPLRSHRCTDCFWRSVQQSKFLRKTELRHGKHVNIFVIETGFKLLQSMIIQPIKFLTGCLPAPNIPPM